MSKFTKLFPIRGRWLHDHPAAVHLVEGKGDDLIASGAFTDDPNHPDRDTDAADLTAEPVTVGETETVAESEPA